MVQLLYLAVTAGHKMNMNVTVSWTYHMHGVGCSSAGGTSGYVIHLHVGKCSVM